MSREGDAALWHKLAQVNGLSGDAVLVEGQQLIVPHGVMRSTHNASTFKAYDPAEALGDVNPAMPAPRTVPKDNKCGGFGAVLLAAVAVAVTALVAPQITPLLAKSLGATGGAIAGGAAAGAAGSIASQGVGLATGLQTRFSWSGVAMAAIGGGAGAASVFGKVAGSELLGNVLSGAAGNAVTQGVALATGLQSKFDWAGVAAAGLGAGADGSRRTRQSGADRPAETTNFVQSNHGENRFSSAHMSRADRLLPDNFKKKHRSSCRS